MSAGNSFKKSEIILALLSLILPFILFMMTSTNILMFDDSAEFATVIMQGSIAHPPGTPAYISLAMLWQSITSIGGLPPVLSLTLFSGFCISLASLLLFLSLRKILQANLESESRKFQASLVAFFTALAFAAGPTTWAWANTIEVYAFQCLTMSICLYGLLSYNLGPNNKNLFIAALGIALGLSNHHVTMIFFLPFVPFFFTKNLILAGESIVQKKKKNVSKNTNLLSRYIAVLKQKSFWMLAGISGVITILFYAWMFMRAQNEYLFMFSKPDTLDSLFFHLRGGAYAKNLTDTSASIISSRVPFFFKLTLEQIGLFIPFLFIGIYFLIRQKKGVMAFLVLAYFFLLFIYQINNNQWASTDAYMLLPFMLLLIPVAVGLMELFEKWKLIYITPLLLIISIIYLYPGHNRKTYPVGKELMSLLDQSAPKNSIILISDWTTVMLFNYYHLVENFRPDLVVLNYDIKFTHYRILPLQYPEFYKDIEAEYTAFVDELTKEHPYQAISTGCDLSTDKLMNHFKSVIHKIEEVAQKQNRSFLTDPRAHVFYSQNKIYNPNRFVSGCFMSSVPGDSLHSELFLDMNFKFLDSPILSNDAGALDKLVDFQAMLDQHMAFYKANNDMLHFSKAEKAHDKVMRLQRMMKKSMSFAYKIK